jgi:glycosyltransferase involved in cell wall biosynthesis
MKSETNQKSLSKPNLRLPRVVALVNTFGIDTKGLSGGDKRAIEILKRFKVNRIDITVVTSKTGKEKYEKYVDANYIIVPLASLDKLGLYIAYSVRSIVSSFLKLGLSSGDILYSTSDFLPSVFPAFVNKSKNKNLKWVQTIHHLIPHPSKRKGSFYTNFLSFCAQRVSFFFIRALADSVIAVSPLLKGELVKLGFDEKKVKVNGNGVNINYFRRIEIDKEKEFEAVFLGRLNPTKGIFDLVDIWENVCKANSSAKLGMIGEVDEQTKAILEKKIVKKNLKTNVDLLGFLDDDEAFSIIKSSRIFVFPSHEEGWGISLCEAMACGLPAVVWDLPIYHLLFPKGIVIVPKGDAQRFANEVSRLLNDGKLYEQMKKDAVEVASEYDWDKVAEEELRVVITI